MLATVMNALALEYAIEKHGKSARALSAVPMPSLCEPFSRQAALHHLGKGRIVVLAGGTGNPFFTTDTGAALRGAELSCDLIMKATQVDGVYSADPKRDPSATRYERLTHDEAIAKNLAVMDTAAFALARENRIPIIVFSIREAGAICRALRGRGQVQPRFAMSAAMRAALADRAKSGYLVRHFRRRRRIGCFRRARRRLVTTIARAGIRILANERRIRSCRPETAHAGRDRVPEA